MTTAYWVCNAGVLLCCGDEKILIDGLHSGDGKGFDGVPEQIKEMVIEGRGIFEDVTTLLITHHHGDHFTQSDVDDFLFHHKTAYVFAPQKAQIRESKQGVWHRVEDRTKAYHISETIKIVAFETAHQGKEFADVVHYGYGVEFEGKRFVFLADGDLKEGDLANAFQGEMETTVFLNPLHLHTKEQREMIKRELSPKQGVVYHLPTTSSVMSFLRTMVQQDISKYGCELPPVTVLTTPLQQIVL